jgi:hypothetical protein
LPRRQYRPAPLMVQYYCETKTGRAVAARVTPRFMAGEAAEWDFSESCGPRPSFQPPSAATSFVEPTLRKNCPARRMARIPRNVRCHLGSLRRIATPLRITPSSMEDLVTSRDHMRAITGRSRGPAMATDGITSTGYVAVRAGAPSSQSLWPTDLHERLGVIFSRVRL